MVRIHQLPCCLIIRMGEKLTHLEPKYSVATQWHCIGNDPNISFRVSKMKDSEHVLASGGVNRPHFLTCFFPSHLPQLILAVTRAVVLGWGWGWLGVGWDVKASLELDRMVYATQLMGWDVKASLELDRMVDATQLMGWDVKASLELDRMVYATQLMGWGRVGCKSTSWAWPHGRCYATYGVGVGWDGVGCQVSSYRA